MRWNTRRLGITIVRSFKDSLDAVPTASFNGILDGFVDLCGDIDRHRFDTTISNGVLVATNSAFSHLENQFE